MATSWRRSSPSCVTARRRPAHAPAQLFELLLGALGRLAETTPTLLVVEDVHWADRATQDLLRFLARNLRDERLLLVVTLRTDEPPAPGPLRTLLAELGGAHASSGSTSSG